MPIRLMKYCKRMQIPKDAAADSTAVVFKYYCKTCGGWYTDLNDAWMNHNKTSAVCPAPAIQPAEVVEVGK